MFRSFTRAFVFGSLVDFDKTKKTSDIEKPTEQETGWDRVKRIFEFDEFGELSKELVTVVHVGLMSSFVGAIYGGVIHSRVAYMNFIKNNQATTFENHFEAKKKLQDKFTISFGKGAWIWAWRLTLFCTSFVTITTVISKYRGKTGILEYVVGGGVSGSLYKFQLGPRGWIVGGVLGSTLGLIGGSAIVALLKVSGVTIDDINQMQYDWKRGRDEYVRKGADEHLLKKELFAIREHQVRLGEQGKDIKEIDT